MARRRLNFCVPRSVFSSVFGRRHHGFHRLHRLNRLHRLGAIASPMGSFADDFARRRPWAAGPWHPKRRRGPSVLRLILAGLAVLAFAKVMSAANARQRSTVEKWIIGGLIVALGAAVLSFRRSGRRYGW